MKSFNILIATIGRPKLQFMLNSLKDQLKEQDCITIVFDGLNSIPEFDLSNFKCKIVQFYEPIALGYWGHGIRTKYSSLIEEKDFVLHADDDDMYLPDVFDRLRTECINKDTLYIGKMMTACRRILPETNEIKRNHIGTPCGIIPYNINKHTIWPFEWGGDGMFYEEISKKSNQISYLDVILYKVRP